MKLTEQEQFFFDHGGWSEPPGREQCARDVAALERWLDDQDDAEFYVELDPDAATTATDEQRERLERGETIYLQALLEIDGETVASLGGIEVESESDPYLRVIRAELAAEARQEQGSAEQFNIYQIDAGVFGVCDPSGENVATFEDEGEAWAFATALNERGAI